MTVDVQREQHQQQRPTQQPDARAQANRDLAREHGNQIAAIADIAEQQLEESEREREDRNRYEDGLQVLRWLVLAPWSERTLEIDRVLHDEHGSLVDAKLGEYLRLLLNGVSSLDARYEMASRHSRRAGRAERTRDAVAAARRVSANLHHMAEAPVSRPALPPVGSGQSNGHVELPHREVPPAPPEKPAEATGTVMRKALDELLAQGHDMSASEAALAQHGYAGPDYLKPDPRFAASSLPVRMGDTQRLIPVYEFDVADEDGAQGFVADGPVEADDAPGPRPLAPAASTAASTSPRPGSGSGADGDDD